LGERIGYILEHAGRHYPLKCAWAKRKPRVFARFATHELNLLALAMLSSCREHSSGNVESGYVETGAPQRERDIAAATTKIQYPRCAAEALPQQWGNHLDPVTHAPALSVFLAPLTGEAVEVIYRSHRVSFALFAVLKGSSRKSSVSVVKKL
jgi:hypothetical protein